jgi:hypothetical protein
MSEHNRLMARTRDSGSGACYIRLNPNHPDVHRAARHLSACGGSEVIELAGMLYVFSSILARNTSLDFVRSKMGFTVASPVDSDPWWRDRPAEVDP